MQGAVDGALVGNRKQRLSLLRRKVARDDDRPFDLLNRCGLSLAVRAVVGVYAAMAKRDLNPFKRPLLAIRIHA